LTAVVLALALLVAPSVARAQTHSWKMATAWSGGPLMDIGA
jgi:hypothetical protein